MMRSTFAMVALLGCSHSPDEVPSTLAFQVVGPDITLAPGQETTRCFYFHTPNTDTVQIHKWISDMAPGSHHMIMFSSLGTQPADGTIDSCDGANVPAPMFATQIPHDEVEFPADDGLGKPLAQTIAPATAGFFQMHYINTTDDTLVAHVEVSAYALPVDVEFTRSEMFFTYNSDIAIPPHATGFDVGATCDVVDRKFWSMSTHAHKQAVTTTVKDGDQVVFSSADWEHPGNQRWSTPDFYTFNTYQMTWQCTYNNTGDNASNTIYDGQSAATNEMCMAIGYFFPATGPRGCLMSNSQCRCLL